MNTKLFYSTWKLHIPIIKFCQIDVELKFNNSFVNILHSNSVTVEGCKMQKILVY